jgi:drug/metabolite transporter (DMT)-like permease
MILAVGLSLGAGGCFAAAAALQHQVASAEPSARAGDPRLLLALVKRRTWLLGGAADLAGLILQTLALRQGALSLVQPLLLSGLILAVPFQAWLERRRPIRNELRGVILAALGLAAFLLAAAPSPGTGDPSTRAWLEVAALAAPVVAVCAAAAGRSVGARRAAWLGVLTGLLYGLSGALLKACADRLTHPSGLLLSWLPYVLVLLGGLGMVLNQNAFQGPQLATPLTALTLTEPLVAVLIGAGAFSEHLHLDPIRWAVLVVAAVAMLAGVQLTRTPVAVGPR